MFSLFAPRLTQKERLLNHFMRTKGKWTTGLDIVKKFWILRYGSVIYRLRKEGHKIETSVAQMKRNGEFVCIPKYRLVDDAILLQEALDVAPLEVTLTEFGKETVFTINKL